MSTGFGAVGRGASADVSAMVELDEAGINNSEGSLMASSLMRSCV